MASKLTGSSSSQGIALSTQPPTNSKKTKPKTVSLASFLEKKPNPWSLQPRFSEVSKEPPQYPALTKTKQQGALSLPNPLPPASSQVIQSASSPWNKIPVQVVAISLSPASDDLKIAPDSSKPVSAITESFKSDLKLNSSETPSFETQAQKPLPTPIGPYLKKPSSITTQELLNAKNQLDKLWEDASKKTVSDIPKIQELENLISELRDHYKAVPNLNFDLFKSIAPAQIALLICFIDSLSEDKKIEFECLREKLLEVLKNNNQVITYIRSCSEYRLSRAYQLFPVTSPVKIMSPPDKLIKHDFITAAYPEIENSSICL